MHSGDLVELEKSDLSEQEKEALLQVMQRAKVSGEVDCVMAAAATLCRSLREYAWRFGQSQLASQTRYCE